MLSEHDLVARIERVTVTRLRVWVAHGWIRPASAAPEAFSEADMARAALIRDLEEDLGFGEEDIPVLGIYKGKTDLQRFIHWNVMKCFWNDEFDFLTNNIINFDWYHPENCFRFEPAEFRQWFADGWEIEAWDVREAGISCRARKV